MGRKRGSQRDRRILARMTDDRVALDLAQPFNTWVDLALTDLASADNSAVAAYCFNLYEHEHTWAVQLAGTSSFDPDDPDWAVEPAFSSGENLFEIPQAAAGEDWEAGLSVAKSLIAQYLRTGMHRERLTGAQAVAVGFVDGDIELVHQRE